MRNLFISVLAFLFRMDLTVNPLIVVHRKRYFLPAGWINEVVVSNISSKPSIYGYCCISYSASRDRQRALKERRVLFGYVLASSLMRLLLLCRAEPQLPIFFGFQARSL